MINLGSPDSTSIKDVRKYLDEFLMDERVIGKSYWFRWFLVKVIILNTRPGKSAKAYRKIWWKEGSPLIVLSQRLFDKVTKLVKFPVALAMRYGSISIFKGLKELDDKGVNYENVKGYGKGGRISKEDALKTLPRVDIDSISKDRKVDTSKMSLLRRKLSQRLVAVKNQTAMLTTFNEVNMTPIFEIRKKYKETFKAKHDVSLGFMSFFTKAVVNALKEFPDVHSMIDEDHKLSFDFYDISIAVSGPKGLLVPVVKNADKLTFSGIEKEIKRLAIKARDGEMSIEDMEGGTFTISNGGVFGSMLSTPILNPPQSSILGMHNIIERPIAVKGKVEIHPMMYLALSYDHRIIDGKESVGFLLKIKEALENPIEILMNNNLKKSLEI